MENLDDAEVGGKQGQEEAPILTAQRYLNIFRQIHIFSKDKRDQFDSELLALPANITDIIKRMPGGRLLIEHIEDLKTERGIAFVKTRKDEFKNNDDTPAVANAASGAVVQGVTGHMVLDSSFAETLAKSMAEAFKQNPRGGGVPADLGNAFHLLAQEIKMSRVSLLDVLRETRSVTDSVIASQVSISRILENILSAKGGLSAGNSDFNNEIMASQASITKLLETLCVSNQKRNEDFDYAKVDEKLENLRNEMKAMISSSYQSLVENLYEHNAKKEEKINDYLNVENKLNAFRNEIRTDIDGSLNNIRGLLHEYTNTIHQLTAHDGKNSEGFTQHSDLDESSLNFSRPESVAPYVVSEKKKLTQDVPVWNPVAQPLADFNSDKVTAQAAEVACSTNPQPSFPIEAHTFEDSVVEDILQSDIHKKKKKKKKKKHNDMQSSNLTENSSLSHISTGTGDNFTQYVVSHPMHDRQFSDDVSTTQTLNTIIRNEAYKHNDNFDHIDLSRPPLETKKDAAEQEVLSSFATTNNDASEHISSEQVSPQKDDIVHRTMEFESLDSLADIDGLDFALPEQKATEPKLEEVVSEAKEPATEFESLDSLAGMDGLDFALPEQKATEPKLEEVVSEAKEPVTEFESLDSLTGMDGLDFALPEQKATEPKLEEVVSEAKEPATEFESLDSLADIDGLDFALPEQKATEPKLEEVVSEAKEPATEFESLDSLVGMDGLDNFSEQSLSREDEIVSSVENPLDDLVSENLQIEPSGLSSSAKESHNQNYKQSRYTAELEKIRAALTSDNVDISSLDHPIALDDYSDDENVLDENGDKVSSDDISAEGEDWEYAYVPEEQSATVVADDNLSEGQDDEDWEWEYVDEDSASSSENTNDEDWEWEYVEDETTSSEDTADKQQ